MLRHALTHPQISRVLGEAGHHATILIADGNYPASTKRGPRSELVSLNLAPGIVTCDQVLAAILSAKSMERVAVMQSEADGPYALGGEPSVWADYRRTLAADGSGLELEPLDKWAFYEAVESPDHVLTVQTADQAGYANILLTVGVRMDGRQS